MGQGSSDGEADAVALKAIRFGIAVDELATTVRTTGAAVATHDRQMLSDLSSRPPRGGSKGEMPCPTGDSGAGKSHRVARPRR